MAWTQSDRVKLRRYFNGSGYALIEELKASRPKIKIDEESTVDSVALRGAKKEGWDEAIDFIQSLSDNADGEKDAFNGGFEDMSGITWPTHQNHQ